MGHQHFCCHAQACLSEQDDLVGGEQNRANNTRVGETEREDVVDGVCLCPRLLGHDAVLPRTPQY